MTKSIHTLTLNPTIDVNMSVEEVAPNRKLRCDEVSREPGGGGLNVSRALARLGAESRALYTAGGPVGDMLDHLLGAEGLDTRPLRIGGWTRENVIVHETGSDRQYRFGAPGPELTVREWQAAIEAAAGRKPYPDFLVASGSLPPGAPEEFYGLLAKRVRPQGTRLVVDTSKAALRATAAAGVFLLKPNRRELAQLVDRRLEDRDAQRAAARELLEREAAEIIVVSLGPEGALVAWGDEVVELAAPEVEVRSRIGAGDSTVAGIVLGLARGEEPLSAAKLGLAAGAAAVMTPGTELCRREDVERLRQAMD